MSKPIIAITMGDPSGVGPEVILKALTNPDLRDLCQPVVMGDVGVLVKAAEDMLDVDCNRLIEPLSSVEKLSESMAQVPVIQTSSLEMEYFKYGEIQPEYGKAAGDAVVKGIELAKEGLVDALVTAPIQKESFKRAGFDYPGHTEMLKHLTGAKHVTLMLMHENFRVVHVTLHQAFRDVAGSIKREAVYETIVTANEGCKSLGISKPRIGVCGLNPHAGEGGLFGQEEIHEILPSINKAKAEGIDVDGPLSSDGVFAMLKGGKFDIVVAMYHDQGGIPMKLLSFNWDSKKDAWGSIRGVNVTLGLPIIRASVAHGTAFEVAGKGVASPDSLLDAIRVARDMAKNKKTVKSS